MPMRIGYAMRSVMNAPRPAATCVPAITLLRAQPPDLGWQSRAKGAEAAPADFETAIIELYRAVRARSRGADRNDNVGNLSHK